MTFYDTTNTHDSVVHYTWHLLGGLGTSDYALADLARAANTSRYNLALKVLKNNDAWDWDERTSTDFHIVTTTLVDGQRDYSLEAEVLKIDHVEVKDANGNYYSIPVVDQKEVLQQRQALTGYGEANSVPKQAWVTKRSIFLDPAPDVANAAVTASAGLRIYYARAVTEFTASTTTSEVGFDTEGDVIIAYMMAEEYASIYREDRLQALQQRRVELEREYLDHMSNRVRTDRPRVKIWVDNME